MFLVSTLMALDTVENLKISAIEKVYVRGEETILKRESLWINLFEAEYQGLNAKK